MSHDGTWREACLSCRNHFVSHYCTTRDKSRRWLWRLVSRLVFCHYEPSSDDFGSLRWIYECHFHSESSIANSKPRRPTPRTFFSETRTHTREPRPSPLSQHAQRPLHPVSFASRGLLLANVKDEPRRDLARGVPFLTKSFQKPLLHDS